jgi:hypothetical protein
MYDSELARLCFAMMSERHEDRSDAEPSAQKWTA